MPDYEIIVVDNDSQSAEAREYFARLRTPACCTSAAPSIILRSIISRSKTATAPWLLFLNNDIEVIESEWLTIMAEHVQRPEVGAVGAAPALP